MVLIFWFFGWRKQSQSGALLLAPGSEDVGNLIVVSLPEPALSRLELAALAVLALYSASKRREAGRFRRLISARTCMRASSSPSSRVTTQYSRSIPLGSLK